MVTIEHTKDASILHSIANKSYPRKMSLTAMQGILDKPGVICLTGEYGAMVFRPLRASEYGMTLLLAPKAAGKWGKAFVAGCFDWMFTNSEARKLIGLSMGREAEAIRMIYTPKGGETERLTQNDHPYATIRWTFEKAAWLSRKEKDANPAA